MQPPVYKQLNDPVLKRIYTTHLARLEALFAGETLEHVFYLKGIEAATENEITEHWELWFDQSLAYLAEHVEHAKDERVFRPLVLCYNPHGVHFVDQLLGADVFYLEGGGWQVHTLTTPVGALQRPNLDTNPFWQTLQAIALRFVACDIPNVTLGLPTIASVLNIAVNLYGQDILITMMDDPEAALHDLRVIHCVLSELHRWFIDHIPFGRFQCILASERHQLPGYGQLCGCTTHLISSAMYNQFIAPLDEALLALYPRGGMIHLCGAHTQHLACWQAMPMLRAVQLNDRAAEDLEAYYRQLRDDQMLYVYPCAGMPVDRILDITGGRRLVVQGDQGPHTSSQIA